MRVHAAKDPLMEMKATGELATLLKGYGKAQPKQKSASARAASQVPRSG